LVTRSAVVLSAPGNRVCWAPEGASARDSGAWGRGKKASPAAPGVRGLGWLHELPQSRGRHKVGGQAAAAEHWGAASRAGSGLWGGAWKVCTHKTRHRAKTSDHEKHNSRNRRAGRCSGRGIKENGRPSGRGEREMGARRSGGTGEGGSGVGTPRGGGCNRGTGGPPAGTGGGGGKTGALVDTKARPLLGRPMGQQRGARPRQGRWLVRGRQRPTV